MKISLLHTFIKAYAKPDSIKVSKLDYANESASPLNESNLQSHCTHTEARILGLS